MIAPKEDRKKRYKQKYAVSINLVANVSHISWATLLYLMSYQMLVIYCGRYPYLPAILVLHY